MANTPDLVYFKDANHGIIMASQAYADAVGCDREDLVGKTATQLWPHEAEEILADERRVLAGEPLISKEREVTTASGESRWYLLTKVPIYQDGEVIGFFATDKDITAHKEAEAELRRIEWLLDREHPRQDQVDQDGEHVPFYGDVTALNTEGLILHSVGQETLATAISGIMDMLDSSVSVYERNGDHAFCSSVSLWCQYMDAASRRLCDTDDNEEALSCGKWLCHENCWHGSARPAIERGEPTDVHCVGGIHLYAVPIRAGDEIVGAVSIGYGTPPTDPETIRCLAERFGVDPNELMRRAKAYDRRPPFIVAVAKRRLQAAARLIGEMVERARVEEALQQRVTQLATLNRIGRDVASIFDQQALLQETIDAVQEDLAYPRVAVLLMDEGGDELYVAAATDNFWKVIPDDYRQSVGEGAIGTAAETGETVRVDDASIDQVVYRVGDWLSPASLSVPIKVGNRVTGVLEVEAGEPDAFDENDQAALETVAAQIAIGLENTELYAGIERRQRYLEGLLRAAPDAIVTLDAHHRIVEWNAGAESLFGYTRDEVVGRDLDPLITTPVTREEATGFTETVMSGEMITPVETVRYRKDGSPVDVLLAGSPIVIKGGFAGAVAVYTDVSELRKAQEALRQHVAELEERNEELDAFSHTVAHDLKNPLQHLVGYAQLLTSDYPELPDDIRRDALTAIVRAADRMNNIIGELLLLAAVRRGEVATEPLDMTAIVAAVQDRLAYMIDQHDAEIIAPETWPQALGHAAWVEEVWANYLSNAIKYGGRPPRLELGATPQPDGAVRFWVRDNGQGLTAEEQASLFTPFRRLHQVKAEGHGLGLSIVRRIMDKLEGDVGVESEVGEGSTFFFTLRQL